MPGHDRHQPSHRHLVREEGRRERPADSRSAELNAILLLARFTAVIFNIGLILKICKKGTAS
jgi:hypothetical protein